MLKYISELLLLICLGYVLPSGVHGYCIYNFTKDTSFFMRQEPMNTGGTYWS